MNIVQFRNLDLNLFKVLQALLEHRSVSRAAENMGLTPSAISHAFGRLRTALNDPLFERRGGALAPTAYAIEIGRRISPSMDQLRHALNREEFDPATAEREFVIGSGSYAALVLLPPIVKRLARTAPGIRLRLHRLEEQSPEDVEHGRIDLLLGISSNVAGRLAWRRLRTERMVWIARKDHPVVRDPLTMEMLADLRHVVIEKLNRVISPGYPDLRRFFDESRELGHATRAVVGRGRRREFGTSMVVTDPMHAIVIASQSDHVTLTLKGFADLFPVNQIQTLAPPHPTPPVELGAIFDPSREGEPGFSWFLSLLLEAVETLSPVDSH